MLNFKGFQDHMIGLIEHLYREHKMVHAHAMYQIQGRIIPLAIGTREDDETAAARLHETLKIAGAKRYAVFHQMHLTGSDEEMKAWDAGEVPLGDTVISDAPPSSS